MHFAILPCGKAAFVPIFMWSKVYFRCSLEVNLPFFTRQLHAILVPRICSSTLALSHPGGVWRPVSHAC